MVQGSCTTSLDQQSDHTLTRCRVQCTQENSSSLNIYHPSEHTSYAVFIALYTELCHHDTLCSYRTTAYHRMLREHAHRWTVEVHFTTCFHLIVPNADADLQLAATSLLLLSEKHQHCCQHCSLNRHQPQTTSNCTTFDSQGLQVLMPQTCPSLRFLSGNCVPRQVLIIHDQSLSFIRG